MKWYKRDPDAAIAGMVGLTLEEQAVYNIVIDFLYSRDGDLPTDDRFFSRACGVRPQMWRRIRDQLIAKGKLHYKTDGKLMANRVQNELESASKLIANMTHLGEVSAEKRRENKADTPTGRKTQPQPQPQPDKKEVEANKEKQSPLRGSAPDTPADSLPAKRSEPAAPSKRRGTRLPENWQPGAAELNFATEQGLRADVLAREIAKFRDYWHARAGAGGVKLDWPATWRNWIRSIKEGKYGFREDKSAGAAARRLAEAAERGQFTFGPRPSLLPEKGGTVVRLLQPGSGEQPGDLQRGDSGDPPGLPGASGGARG